MRKRIIRSILWLKGYRYTIWQGDPAWMRGEYGTWEAYFCTRSLFGWLRY